MEDRYDVHYPVLAGKIAERGIKKCAIAKSLGVDAKTLRNKMSGKAEFTWPEVITMRDVFFPEVSVEQLMKRA